MDFSKLKLGKKTKRHDDRTLVMAHYFKGGALPPTPAAFTWSKGMKSWGQMLNDAIGDCTCAAVGHAIQVWTQIVAVMLTLADAAIQAAYVAVTGQEGAAYNPATGANDNGCVILDVLNYWRQIGVGGHKIAAYMTLDHASQAEVLLGGSLFGGLYGGVNLPLTARDQISAGQVWDVPAGGAKGRGRPGSWGGHATWIVDCNATGPVALTWGALQQMTWAFWLAYYDEAYVALSADWMNAQGVSGAGFDYATMQADMAAITGAGPVAPPSPVNPPTPAPTSQAAQVLADDDAAFAALATTFARVRGAAAALSASDAALKARHQALFASATFASALAHPAAASLNWQQIMQDVQTLLPIIEQVVKQQAA
jgi:hypothetical protein